MKRTLILLATLGLTQTCLAADTPQAVAERMLDPTRNAAAWAAGSLPSSAFTTSPSAPSPAVRILPA